MRYPMRLAPLTLLAMALLVVPAAAQKNNAPGISDTEIKIGQTMPYSGPTSAWGTGGRAELAYFEMVNQRGGVNGRKIKLISLDDGFSPPKTMEQIRKLVEQEQVAFIFSSIGAPTNLAVRKYLNDHKVPQLLVLAGSAQFNDPSHFPWSINYFPTAYREGITHGQYIREHKPDARIAILYPHNDYGREFIRGLQDGLGPEASKLIVKTETAETTDPTVDGQIVSLQASGADTFVSINPPKLGAQAIRKAYEIGWHPLLLINSPSSSIEAVFKPAGLEKAVGIISTGVERDPNDPSQEGDAWRAWMKDYFPSGDIKDSYNVTGYDVAKALVYVLEQCGDDLSRENIMRHATNIHDLHLPMLEGGITVNTTPADYEVFKTVRERRFNGTKWEWIE
jgi:branched-chain amino acid transport system substrate-binding protein